MQLGARWRVGDQPHRSVPADLLPLISETENAHPEATAWTLTWLEGRPELALDDVPLAELASANGSAATDAAEDDWLS